MTQSNINKKKILVVEDEQILGRLCVKILTLDGYAVDLAVNGLVAKDMIKSNKYDICLTDIRTPEMNGMELYKYLEENHPSLAEKTIFMTGDVMNKGINAFIENNKVRCILKPFTQVELVAAIKELMK
ncbi:MAG: response regulator [Dehalococcoidales bacterium]